ncbi:Mitochondrial import receptor subunit TOM7-like protein [Nibea albiflora]|uniref:Mitochondrial import receptor subunit TOM7-like protein n=1 Tax=Nibea albiflora TaxID=240163 RepID=A0ACB7ETM5_NIBAL|nr:Mitochondrial import receptor subunit TOM7-like protein [Nibea albiflora]
MDNKRRLTAGHVTSSYRVLGSSGCSVILAVRAKHMAKMSKETKQRLQQLFQCGQFVIRWGFIPTVLYLGQYPNGSSGERGGLRRHASQMLAT